VYAASNNGVRRRRHHPSPEHDRDEQMEKLARAQR